MNNYDFQFEDSYQGYWDIPSIGTNLPGLLYMENSSIRLEIFLNMHSTTHNTRIKEAKGYAYPKEFTKTCYYITLQELYCTKCSVFGNHQSRYTFDICSLILTDDKDLKIDSIRSFCIRMHLLDKWVWDYTCDSYNYNIPITDQDNIIIEYTPKPSLHLIHNDEYRYYIKFGSGVTLPSAKGANITTKSFLNVEFGQNVLFDLAYRFVNQTNWLFSLLMGDSTHPDFIEFRTNKSRFIYKQSDKHLFQYITKENETLHTSISDFNCEDFTTIISNWIEYSNQNSESIDTFFETLYNEHLSPSVRLKNYVSVIDGLTRCYTIAEKKGQKEGKKAQDILDILEKTKSILSKDDYNRLKMAVFRQSPKDLKVRFEKFREELGNVVSINLEEDFCLKVIGTRNHITHPSSNIINIYPREILLNVVKCIEDMIKVKILRSIGVSTDITKKIVRNISLEFE